MSCRRDGTAEQGRGRLIVPLVCLLALGGCSSMEAAPKPVEPLRGAPVQQVSTAYTPSLECVAAHARRQDFPPPRIAVGHITDATGAVDYFDGNRVTQGATLMAISAVAKSGMRLVERFDLGIAQVDLDYAQKQLLRDAPNRLREVGAGQMQGTDLYLVGGITEFNPNIRSRDADLFGSAGSSAGVSLGLGATDFVFDVAIDLRLVDSRSTEVLMVRSLRKQLRSYEIEAGILGSFADVVLDLGGGQRRLEPTQTGVRSMIERAVFEFMASLYNLPVSACPTPEGAYPAIDASRSADAAAPTAGPASASDAPRQATPSAAPATRQPRPADPPPVARREPAPDPDRAADAQARAASPAAVDEGTIVRVATFSDAANAEAMVSRLREMGIAAQSNPVAAPDGEPFVDVSIGPFPDTAAAEAARRRVQAEFALDTPRATASTQTASRPTPPAPASASAQAPTEAPATTADDPAAPSPQRTMVLAVAATEDRAVERWRTVSAAHPDILGDAQAGVRQIEIRGQPAYALVATAADGDSAPDICEALRARGAECALAP